MQEGSVIAGKYRVVRKLGEGGMGSVWLARNEVTERAFAIKVMSEQYAASEALLARFLQEARVAGKLRHPGLLEIFDAGVAQELGGAPYLVMELLDGVGLDEAIRAAKRLPLGTALEIAVGVCRAVAAIHDKGIVHRDLKPSNVFLHRPGTGALIAKVLDFGISKLTVKADNPQAHTLTQTGHVLGSPLYMSPEQATGDKTLDARSDIHAMGVLLFECVAGEPPFRAETYAALSVQIMVHERRRLDAVVPGVPREIADLAARAMSIDRAARPASAHALADALEAAMQRIGHVPTLDGRDGADQFFGMLGSLSRARSANATAGDTVLVTSDPPAAPGRAAAPKPSAPSPAMSQLEPSSINVAHSSTQRTRWLLPAATLVVGAVGASIALIAFNASRHAEPAAEPEASALVPTSQPSAQPPDAEPERSAPPPLAASSAPEPEPPPSPPAHTKPPRPAGTRTAPSPSPSPTKTAKPPPHHGVVDDGL